MKNLLIGLLLLFALGVGASTGYYFGYDKGYENAVIIRKIVTFEDCRKAGYPVMESYPRKCNTPDGRSLVEEISNALQYKNEINVSKPQPNARVTNPLVITGQARGIWFFEANFSAELFDADDNSLGTAIIQAEGEWMTDEFVPFSGKLEFSPPNTRIGKLVVYNANPSGLPENEKEFIIPIRFQNEE